MLPMMPENSPWLCPLRRVRRVGGDGVGVGCSKSHGVTLHAISLELACGGLLAKFLMSFDQRENVLSKGTQLSLGLCGSLR